MPQKVYPEVWLLLRSNGGVSTHSSLAFARQYAGSRGNCVGVLHVRPDGSTEWLAVRALPAPPHPAPRLSAPAG